MIRPTQQQLAILDWLRRFPEVRLGRNGISHKWASASAMESMNSAVQSFGMGEGITTERAGMTGGEETPLCRRRTAELLKARGWVTEGGELSTEGREVIVRHGRALHGYEAIGFNHKASNPRRVGEVEIKRRGGRAQAVRAMEYHRLIEAEHKRIADHIEASLKIYDEDIGRSREAWRANHAGRARK